MIAPAREEGNGSDAACEESLSAHGPLHVIPTKEAPSLPSECDATAATNVMRISYALVSFRPHETVIAVPQGGMSTVPSPTLGRVTEYTDHKGKSVDEYEQQRDGKRKKYNKLDDCPPRSRILSSPRGKQRRQKLKALHRKSAGMRDADGEFTNSTPQRSPGNRKATDTINGQENKDFVKKRGLITYGSPSPLKESFGSFRSSVTEMSKQFADRWSTLFSLTAAGNDGKGPGNGVSNTSPETENL